ncbi:MAG: Tm-1-like ATP-binding domain-containing protein, partial [Saccharopolyspora sp.]|uniref:Tm-1-like ATP-binding domain-containing protein n=1 Tax=Saccharopolyspora sp. TaxID=33915 RepID=UPI0025CEF7C3
MGRAYVVGTFDTKGAELRYVAGLAAAGGVQVGTVDLSTSGDPADNPDDVDVSATEVAAAHPRGAGAVFT